MNGKFDSADLREESVMDTSIGSDGEWSSSCISPRSPAISPTESEKGLPIDLKFSIANILRPEFGIRRESPSPCRKGTDSAFSVSETLETLQNSVEENKQNASSVAADAAAATAAALGFAQPIIWPAWVYCTRYSDRPSSVFIELTARPRPPSREMRRNYLCCLCKLIYRPKDVDIVALIYDSFALWECTSVYHNCPRCRRMKRKSMNQPEEKRPRTAFTADQLNRLKDEFQENRYLTEKRRQELAHELGLNESQIKIWFQNKRAKIKKQVGCRNPLAFHLMAQGLYNHATVPVSNDYEEENQDLDSKVSSSS